MNWWVGGSGLVGVRCWRWQAREWRGRWGWPGEVSKGGRVRRGGLARGGSRPGGGRGGGVKRGQGGWGRERRQNQICWRTDSVHLPGPCHRWLDLSPLLFRGQRCSAALSRHPWRCSAPAASPVSSCSCPSPSCCHQSCTLSRLKKILIPYNQQKINIIYTLFTFRNSTNINSFQNIEKCRTVILNIYIELSCVQLHAIILLILFSLSHWWIHTTNTARSFL